MTSSSLGSLDCTLRHVFAFCWIHSLTLGVTAPVAPLPLRLPLTSPPTSVPVVPSGSRTSQHSVLLPSDGTVSWDHRICHNCPPRLPVSHHYVWLVSQQLLVSLDLEISQDLSSVVCSIRTWGLVIHTSRRCSWTLSGALGHASQCTLFGLQCAGLSQGHLCTVFRRPLATARIL